jgi:hypothetical protein
MQIVHIGSPAPGQHSYQIKGERRPVTARVGQVLMLTGFDTFLGVADRPARAAGVNLRVADGGKLLPLAA